MSEPDDLTICYMVGYHKRDYEVRQLREALERCSNALCWLDRIEKKVRNNTKRGEVPKELLCDYSRCMGEVQSALAAAEPLLSKKVTT